MTIKFSHHYIKMPPDYKLSRLTSIDIVRLQDLSPEFIDHDTAISGGGHYHLVPKGKYMILRLESSIMNIRWQTIRPWRERKEKYYKRYIGKLVDCKIEET